MISADVGTWHLSSGLSYRRAFCGGFLPLLAGGDDWGSPSAVVVDALAVGDPMPDRPWQFLYFRPLPQGQGSLRSTSGLSLRTSVPLPFSRFTVW